MIRHRGKLNELEKKALVRDMYSQTGDRSRSGEVCTSQIIVS